VKSSPICNFIDAVYKNTRKASVRAVNMIAENDYFERRVMKPALDNPNSVVAFLLAANVAKDVLKHGTYAYQSINNKEIPADKRKYVASLDIAMGLATVAAQIVTGLTIANEKLQNAIAKKLFGKLLDPSSDISKNLKNMTLDGKKILEAEKLFRGCSKGFIAVSTLVVSQIIAKRLLVPFVAPALASNIKNNFLENDKEKIASNSNKKEAFKTFQGNAALEKTFSRFTRVKSSSLQG
jgi:hypothetical protein